MTEEDLIDELEREPFQPFRIYLVSGKTLDVLTPNAAHPLRNSLLVLRIPAPGSRRAHGYDIIAYENVERLEQLMMGKERRQKRKPA
jgi:hypothetical protein